MMKQNGCMEAGRNIDLLNMRIAFKFQHEKYCYLPPPAQKYKRISSNEMAFFFFRAQ